MRRVNAIAILGRAIGGTVSSVEVTSRVAQRRALQAAMFNSYSSSSPFWFTQRLVDRIGQSSSSVVHGVAGTMCFSAATAASISHDSHPTESLSSDKYLPKELVLYQYEACPFCNKVRGKFYTLFRDRFLFFLQFDKMAIDFSLINLKTW